MEKKAVIRNFVGRFLDESALKDDDNIFESGLVNSLFAMQLVVFLEEEFDISISNNEIDIENFRSINAISALIDKKV